MTAATAQRTAEHRPATRKRRYRHDDIIAGDLFSGFGGLTRGMEAAGVTTIMAANHNRYKVEIHEANHPIAEHFVADLVDPDRGDYYAPAELPKVDWLAAGVSCVSHSTANSKKAYAQHRSLFDFDDPEWDARVTKSERDRATSVCVLQYAQVHRPKVMLIECTTELVSWGPGIPGKNIGDGSTYRWWMREMLALGYRCRTLYLNSMFFGTPQSRDRLYLVFTSVDLREPDLDHRPASWCHGCDRVVEAVWTWRTGIPRTGRVRYGHQYDYRCPSCRSEVVPPMTPSIGALDLTNLGTRIGDRAKPLAESSMARVERCIRKFRDFPAVLMPAKAMARGAERHPWQPMATQTSQQDKALLSTGALAAAVDNFQGAPRGLDESLPTVVGAETMGLLSAAVMANRTNATPRGLDEPVQTVVAAAGSGGLGVVSAGVIPFRRNTLPTTHAEPMPTQVANQVPGLLCAGFYKQNGGPQDTAPHPVTDPLGTMTSRDTTGLTIADWHQMLDGLEPEDCYFRMLTAPEVGRGCGFDDTFIVWGSTRDQVDGYGNAVSPNVGTWISLRIKEVL